MGNSFISEFVVNLLHKTYNKRRAETEFITKYEAKAGMAKRVCQNEKSDC